MRYYDSLRALADQPRRFHCPPITTLLITFQNLAQTSYDDPYGYIAEAVRRTAEEVSIMDLLINEGVDSARICFIKGSTMRRTTREF